MSSLNFCKQDTRILPSGQGKSLMNQSSFGKFTKKSSRSAADFRTAHCWQFHGNNLCFALGEWISCFCFSKNGFAFWKDAGKYLFHVLTFYRLKGCTFHTLEQSNWLAPFLSLFLNKHFKITTPVGSNANSSR